MKFPGADPVCQRCRGNTHPRTERAACKTARTDTKNTKNRGRSHPSGDFVVLVIPIDKAAPKGRLILPQQQTIRDILDHGATAIAVRDSELSETLKNLGRTPALVITDSQVFDAVAKIVPREIPLTSFRFYLPDTKEI